jgi:hypothetical protein
MPDADAEQPDLLSMLMPTNPDEAQAMLRAIQGQQADQGQQRSDLQRLLGQQTQQAGNLRGLALVASLGSNPLLQGLRQTAEQQGMGLDNAAARTESRLAGTRGILGKPMDPLALIRLQQAAQRMQQQKDMADNKAKSAADAASGKATQQGYAMEDKLRKEFQALPAYKNYQTVATAYDSMRQAAALDSPQGDLTLITTFMKSIDPSTGVKDQEFNNAQRAGGMFDKAQAAYEYVVTGKRLTPAMRNGFMDAARHNVNAFKGQHDSALTNYKKLAEGYGVDPERVAMPVGLDLDAPAQSDAATPSSLPPAPGGRVGPGDPRNVLSTETLADGTIITTYGNGRIVKRTPKRK